eukprot:SM000073S21418  [mRNA]  locus=s73:164872:167526:+ [translate_table: standard]
MAKLRSREGRQGNLSVGKNAAAITATAATGGTSREARKVTWRATFRLRIERARAREQVGATLALLAGARSPGDRSLLARHAELAAELEQRKAARDAKVERMAQGGVVLHTGAGISTGAGVRDFRGPRGVWTLQAKGLVVEMAQLYESLKPTLAHRVIVELVTLDGLHCHSGLPPASLSELHGCVFIEKCDKCGAKYQRSFNVTSPQGSGYRRHGTDRSCSSLPLRPALYDNPSIRRWSAELPQESKNEQSTGVCGAPLMDTIVHFGEKLDARVLQTAREVSGAAHLSLCIGTTLKVPPASKLPRLSSQVVIINLQWTPLDRAAVLKINGKADQVLARLAELLLVKISPPLTSNQVDDEQDTSINSRHGTMDAMQMLIYAGQRNSSELHHSVEVFSTSLARAINMSLLVLAASKSA